MVEVWTRPNDGQKAPCEALSDTVRTRQEGSCLASELRLGPHGGYQVSEMWTQATEMEKGPYEALSQIDRVRHQSEVEAYNYRCASLPPTLPGRTPEPVWFVCQLSTPVCWSECRFHSNWFPLFLVWTNKFTRCLIRLVNGVGTLPRRLATEAATQQAADAAKQVAAAQAAVEQASSTIFQRPAGVHGAISNGSAAPPQPHLPVI